MRRPPPRAPLFLALLAGCSLRLSGPEPGRGAPATGAPCATAADCPTPKEPCLVAACPAGACAVEVAPARAVPAEQPAGDCKQLVCDGRGQAITRDDPADTPLDDGNDCTEERCVGAEPEHAPLAAGTPCGQGGVCNGGILCGVCVPKKGRCVEAAPEFCDASGQWARSEACTGASPVCSRGACAGVAELVLGEAETCARLSDGSARCWGANREGKLSEGAGPLRVGVAGAVELALGHGHACARLRDGTVSCWGNNAAGELGDGTRADRGAPVSVVGLKGAVQLAAGDHHTCARLADGRIACWGQNHKGQLGDGGGAAAPRAIPVGAPAAEPAATAQLDGPFAQLALGGDRACARLGDGSVECWGQGARAPPAPAAAPLPHAVPRPPAPVPAKSGKAVPPPPSHVAALAAATRVVRGLVRVTEIALGADHGCARLGDGSVSCWGANAAGQLGDGSTSDRHAPVRVGAIKRAAGLALGRAHTCALLADGAVWCWGDNTSGQLGDGSITGRRAPTLVAGLAGVAVIAARGDHTCARLGDGSVRCWGDNVGGDLGDGSTSARPAPVEVRW